MSIKFLLALFLVAVVVINVTEGSGRRRRDNRAARDAARRRQQAAARRRHQQWLARRRRQQQLARQRAAAARRRAAAAAAARRRAEAARRRAAALARQRRLAELARRRAAAARRNRPMCRTGGRVELVFVVSSSYTIGNGNFQTMKRFLVRWVNSLRMSHNGVRVGVVQFSTFSSRVCGLTSNKNHVRNKIRGLQYDDGITATGDGLNDARKILRRARHGAQKIVVLLSTDESNFGEDPIRAARKLKRSGAKVSVIGISSHVNKSNLRKIATGRKYRAIRHYRQLNGNVRAVRGC